MANDTTDRRRFAPAAQRNREPIRAVLAGVLPELGLALEIASGSGEHSIYFARHFPRLDWQPSDPERDNRASIDAWRAAEGLANLRAALDLDVAAEPWPIAQADAVLCINMIHIAPWAATAALLRGAARLLPAGAPLCLYGPYKRDGAHTAPSNAEFDASLRARNPDWGLRDMAAVSAQAADCGFDLRDTVAMPANNFTLVFRRRARAAT